jgi:hypothetical protein
MLVYEQQGQLWAFYQGQNFLVENYIPSSYKFHQGIIAYFDQNGYLNLFNNGEKSILTYKNVNDYKVLRKIVIYNEGMNTTKIYYNNKTYSVE